MGEFLVEDADGPRWEPIRQQMMIGRAWNNDLVVRSATASRRHAYIWCLGDQLVLEDLQSRNGTLVNGRFVTRPLLLYHNDIITIGGARLTVVALREPAAPSLCSSGDRSPHDAGQTPPGGTRPGWLVSQLFCPRCDAANLLEARYCVRCGQALGVAVEVARARQGEEERTKPARSPTPIEPVVARPFPEPAASGRLRSRSDRKILILILLVAIVAVILIMSGVLLAQAVGQM
jgi:hypothetical protein